MPLHRLPAGKRYQHNQHKPSPSPSICIPRAPIESRPSSARAGCVRADRIFQRNKSQQLKSRERSVGEGDRSNLTKKGKAITGNNDCLQQQQQQQVKQTNEYLKRKSCVGDGRYGRPNMYIRVWDENGRCQNSMSGTSGSSITTAGSCRSSVRQNCNLGVNLYGLVFKYDDSSFPVLGNQLLERNKSEIFENEDVSVQADSDNVNVNTNIKKCTEPSPPSQPPPIITTALEINENDPFESPGFGEAFQSFSTYVDLKRRDIARMEMMQKEKDREKTNSSRVKVYIETPEEDVRNEQKETQTLAQVDLNVVLSPAGKIAAGHFKAAAELKMRSDKVYTKLEFDESGQMRQNIIVSKGVDEKQDDFAEKEVNTCTDPTLSQMNCFPKEEIEKNRACSGGRNRSRTVYNVQIPSMSPPIDRAYLPTAPTPAPTPMAASNGAEREAFTSHLPSKVN